MKPYTWAPEQSQEEQKNGAYFERNMLALYSAMSSNEVYRSTFGFVPADAESGWYPHEGEGFEGWSRVISINGGVFTFHVPDDFDLGDLPQIAPNWDGHTTEEKWTRIMIACGCKLEAGDDA